MDDYIIELKNISMSYSGVCALDSVNLNVRRGEFLGIIGPNGGGKSTLLKIICGLIKPSGGQITINSSMPVGYVPQFSSFSRTFPISVLDVTLTGTLPGKLSPFHRFSSEDISNARKNLALMGIGELEKRQIGKLSGGQLQKVLLARALSANPDILLLDEPTASIDSTSRTDIYALLKELSKSRTIIIVSHDIGAVSSYVDTIACLNRKLFYHGDEQTPLTDSLERVYGCHIDLIAHGVPHRVLNPHIDYEEDKND
ncbi:ABC-type Mn/Zn transport systems, ATPase component MntB [Peptoclostridium acidaminophilum DSM 3953]|uniref:ABC-type Mn/Zn transport systems, ATPase component MntB n=1 Tax=Peptoclostridium acidaminophilum DSM 3953 TaxID=1286171 RepID=W8TGR6_PEPAC|nr:metal ABC transporter ATP-binding protein [Peptoclostridium acidaminophilum]AHM57028.1 ABC-type Mn/Zn transport systems, ATPase component MntB [Peptoclostridium acidaminophilum DSM 3953]